MTTIRPNSFIICASFLAPDGATRLVGGIQTYVIHLAKIISELGLNVAIIQASSTAFETRVNDFVLVRGIRVPAGVQGAQLARKLVAGVSERTEDDLVVFATEQVSCRLSSQRTVLVQHGVSWDMDFSLLPSRGLFRSISIRAPLFRALRKHFQQIRYRRYLSNATVKVCVDYNYPNWLRATAPSSATANVHVIPNPPFPQDRTPSRNPHPGRGGTTRVIFSRRFERYRGCLVMAQAARQLLEASHPIQFTFAGEGPELAAMRDLLRGYEAQCTFTKYSPEESLAIHAEFDIAVVPSLASEGTSLAVIEAMASGCAVIATPIGGITNVLIDDYNGLFVEPGSSEALSAAILRLHLSTDNRARLGRNAKSVVEQSCYSFDNWRKSWQSVISKVLATAPHG